MNNIKDKILNFAQNYNSAFIVINFPFDKVIFSNKTAESLYQIKDGSGNNEFEIIFPYFDLTFNTKVKNGLKNDNQILLENVITVKADKTEQLANLVVGYFNEEKNEIFLEVTPKKDNRLEMAIFHVDSSSKPEAILNLDDELTIVHANEYFNEVVEPNRNLANKFSLEKKESLLKTIHSTLKNASIFTTKLQIFTTNNEEKWYLLELEKRSLDNSGTDKIIAYMTNIEKQKALEKEFNTVKQYMNTMQKFTKDMVYIIDYKTMTLHHSIDVDGISPKLKKFGKSIPNYIDVFIKEDIIHPDDQQKYLDALKLYYEDKISECEIRFAIRSEEYQWYVIKGDKICNEQGIVTQIVGIIENIHKQYEIKSEYSLLDQYFKSMQKLSENILYQIDIKSKTMRHVDQKALNLGIPEEIENFVDVFINGKIIHPDDVEIYREYTDKLFAGEELEFKIRSATEVGVYEWFNVKNTFIYNEQGVPIEIFGIMENIQNQVNLEKKAYFDSLTRVLNRDAFESKVKQELENVTEDIQHAMVFIDVDNFKFINDTYGHQFGDFILEKFAERMNNCIKSSDLIGRIGGDEFVVYLKGIAGEKSALDRANTMLERMKSPISNGEISHKLGMSIGIAIMPQDGKTFESLYNKADKGVYASKKRGKNVATLYSDALNY